MGRHKRTTAFEQTLLRLRYDCAARVNADILLKKPTNWSINSPRDGICDMLAKELEDEEPPRWYNSKIVARTNAIWRISVQDRTGLNTEDLITQRTGDLAAARQWMKKNVKAGSQTERDMINLLGLGYQEKYINGPLGGTRHSNAELETSRLRKKVTIRLADMK